MSTEEKNKNQLVTQSNFLEIDQKNASFSEVELRNASFAEFDLRASDHENGYADNAYDTETASNLEDETIDYRQSYFVGSGYDGSNIFEDISYRTYVRGHNKVSSGETDKSMSGKSKSSKSKSGKSKSSKSKSSKSKSSKSKSSKSKSKEKCTKYHLLQRSSKKSKKKKKSHGKKSGKSKKSKNSHSRDSKGCNPSPYPKVTPSPTIYISPSVPVKTAPTKISYPTSPPTLIKSTSEPTVAYYDATSTTTVSPYEKTATLKPTSPTVTLPAAGLQDGDNQTTDGFSKLGIALVTVSTLFALITALLIAARKRRMRLKNKEELEELNQEENIIFPEKSLSDVNTDMSVDTSEDRGLPPVLESMSEGSDVPSDSTTLVSHLRTLPENEDTVLLPIFEVDSNAGYSDAGFEAVDDLDTLML